MLALGPAQLDLETRVLTVGAQRIVLQQKPYLVLVHLVENRHRLVTRRELLDRFWEGKDVYDQSLSKAVGSIRRALGDVEGETFIETRWGLGYRYIGPFAEVSAHPSPPAGGQSTADASPKPALTVEPQAAATVPRDPNPSAPGRPRWPPRAGGLLSLLAAACLIVTLAFAGLYRRSRRVDAATAPIRSVAVLPFTAGGDDIEGQYVGLEMADNLAARLSTIPQLSVRSSATVRSVVGLEANPVATARKLAVQAVVTGQVRRTAAGLVIAVQLLDPVSGTARWSGVFDDGRADDSGAEEEIAQTVSRALFPGSAGTLLRPSPGRGTSNPDAYGDYMKARFFAIARTRSSLGRAVGFLLEATQIDPDYARAWAALAECYSLEGFYQYVPPAEAYPRAQQAAEKALSLNHSLAEAHVILLSILTDYDWDWQGAEREFQAAIAIDPRSAEAYQYYGYALLGMGRGDEALMAMRQALRIDPVSPSVGTSLAWGYYLLRHNQEAAEQCRRVLDLYPNYVPAHQLLGLTWDQMGYSRLAMAELRRAAELESSNAMTPLYIDYELARSGQQALAARNLTSLTAQSGRIFVPEYFLAAAWIATGDRKKAETCLARAFQARSNWLIYLRYDPRFDALRGDSDFTAILGHLQPQGQGFHPVLALNSPPS